MLYIASDGMVHQIGLLLGRRRLTAELKVWDFAGCIPGSALLLKQSMHVLNMQVTCMYGVLCPPTVSAICSAGVHLSGSSASAIKLSCRHRCFRTTEGSAASIAEAGAPRRSPRGISSAACGCCRCAHLCCHAKPQPSQYFTQWLDARWG